MIKKYGFVSIASMLLCVSACVQPPANLAGPTSTLSEPRWNSSDHLTNPFPPTSPRSLTIAISRAGDMIAFPIPNKRTSDGRILPSEGLLVVDLEKRQVRKFTYRIPNLELVDPTFSPDASLIAFVATPTPRFGWGEIWIASVDGSPRSRVNECERSYMAPRFSVDGKRIAYFRDLWTPASAPTGMWPEYRSTLRFQPWGVFELDLATARDEQVSQTGWRLPNQLRYDEMRNGIVVWALEQLKLVNTAKGPAWQPVPLYQAPAPAPTAARAYEAPRTHYIEKTGATWAVGNTPAPLVRSIEQRADLLDFVNGAYIWTVASPPLPYRNIRVVRQSAGMSQDLFGLDDLTGRATQGSFPTGLFFSEDACTATYWAGSLESPRIAVAGLCQTSPVQIELMSIDDLEKNAVEIELHWIFGDAC